MNFSKTGRLPTAQRQGGSARQAEMHRECQVGSRSAAEPGPCPSGQEEAEHICLQFVSLAKGPFSSSAMGVDDEAGGGVCNSVAAETLRSESSASAGAARRRSPLCSCPEGALTVRPEPFAEEVDSQRDHEGLPENGPVAFLGFHVPLSVGSDSLCCSQFCCVYVLCLLSAEETASYHLCAAPRPLPWRWASRRHASECVPAYARPEGLRGGRRQKWTLVSLSG